MAGTPICRHIHSNARANTFVFTARADSAIRTNRYSPFVIQGFVRGPNCKHLTPSYMFAHGSVSSITVEIGTGDLAHSSAGEL